MAEAWTTQETLKVHPELAVIVDRYNLIAHNFPEAWRQYEITLKSWQKDHPQWRDSFQHDTGNEALGWGWARPDFADGDWKPLELPRMLEGIVNFNGAFWFRRQIDIPAAWAGKDLESPLGAIDDFDTTYFNGQQIGATGSDGDQTYNLPRFYKVPGSLVKAGKATLAVRVFDHFGGGGFGGSANQMKLSLCEGQTLSVAGTWKFKVEKAYDPSKLKPWPAGMPSPPSIATLLPGGLFNGMIYPLCGSAFRGAIWYQGESNGDRGWQYQTLLPAMIGDWRQAAGRDFEFLIVQLPSNGGDWCEVREAQALTAQNTKHCGLAVTLDIDDWDLHPKIKQPVGERLAMQALAKVYDRKIVCGGPVYKSMKIEKGRIRLSFDLGGGRLIRGIDNSPMHNFTIAGVDRKFVPAKAAVDGDTVVVWADEVATPSPSATPGARPSPTATSTAPTRLA